MALERLAAAPYLYANCGWRRELKERKERGAAAGFAKTNPIFVEIIGEFGFVFCANRRFLHRRSARSEARAGIPGHHDGEPALAVMTQKSSWFLAAPLVIDAA